MTAPLVSIVVPSFNQGRYIGETLESIFAQDYRPLEVLVSDGGSTDETKKVLERLADRSELVWWSAPDGGVCDAVNQALARARGDVIAIQSSDDVYLPGAVSTAVAFLQARPDVVLAFGDVEYMDERSRPTGRTFLRDFDISDYLARRLYIPQPAAFFRAEACRAAGGWRDEVSYAADADFWLRLSKAGRVTKIPALLARYRYHSEQRDRHGERVAIAWERSVREFLDASEPVGGLRRWADLGIHLTRHHYTAEEDWRKRTVHLYRAALAHPKAVFWGEFPKRELLPAREPIWRLLSRVKRALGFRPRGAAH
jgi:glycosyltransferase involved in cell wall biosynthesis